MKRQRTIVFAKAPRPGFAKTRLIPALGACGAAALARRMLAHTLAAALEAGTGTVELCATPAYEHPDWSSVDIPDGVDITAQGEGDLGARMARAARRGLARAEAVLLVGTDCAEMSATLLRGAAARLDEVDALMHPTADGGYAVLGLARYDACLFERIAWSTDTVAATTIGRLRTLGWRLHVGAALHDIDEPRDLVHLEIGRNPAPADRSAGQPRSSHRRYNW